MTYQADDTPIIVEVVDGKTGDKIDANDFVAGKYEISTLTGTVLFSAIYPGTITIQDENFKLVYPSDMNTQIGSLRHEMRVKDISGNESTIVQQIINNNQTSVRL